MQKLIKLSFVLVMFLFASTVSVQAALSDLGITTRQDWGADESYLLYRELPESSGTSSAAWSLRRQRCEALQAEYPNEFKNDGSRVGTTSSGEKLHWTRTYSSAIKKIIIHETASDNSKDYVGDDGKFTVEDARVVLRAIYKTHALSRGWGDIGYHYLIDPFGNIYEGRSGGARVIGAHVYCANTGTIGISFIGSFEAAPPTADAKQAAVELIGELSNLYDLDPSEFSTWHGKNTRNLVGHRDYGASADPLPPLYDIIPELAAAAAEYARGNELIDSDYSHRLIASNSPLLLDSLTTGMIELTLRNNGQKTWPVGTTLRVARGSRGKNRLGAQLGSGGDTIATLDRYVAQGQTVNIQIPVTTKMKAGRYRFAVNLDFDGVQGEKFYLVVNVAEPTLGYEFVSAKHPPQPFAPGQEALAWVQLLNTSSFTWRASGENRVYLAALPTGSGAAFTADGSDELAALDVDVAPGQAARFVMNLTAPERAQRYYLKFAPKVANFGLLPDYGMQFHTTVREPKFAATVLKKSKGTELYFQPGETKELFIEFKNTSQLIWTPEDFSLVAVRTGNIQLDLDSAVLPDAVPKGETVRVPLVVTAPAQGGQFTLSVRPRWTSGRVKTASAISFAITVAEASLTAQLIEAPRRLEISKGEATEITVAYKNTGNVIWRNAGNNPIKLGTYRPYDRESIVSDASWEAPTRPAVLTEDSVAPGEVGHFTFTIAKNTGGRQDEWFAPVIEGAGWLAQMPVRIMVLEVKGSENQIAVDIDSSTDSPSTDASSSLAASVLDVSPEVETADPTLDTSPDIRIRLSFDSDRVEIGGGPLILQTIAGRELFRGTFLDFDSYKLNEGEAYRVVPQGDTILEVANWAHNPGWSTALNDNRYRGILEVRKYNDELIVINELPVEDYVRGVAEPLPSDPWEKAKLLAVLARSYTLSHTDPLHRKFSSVAPYDGSDNPAEFQRYLGYSYELRGQMSAAVDATAGLVATYSGKVVKTPYFTSSSGRTRTAAEARWSTTDFVFTKSVSDPWSCGLNSSAIDTDFSCPEQAAGHGVGVSGKGAAGLAQEGKTYTEIIDYFFDGLEVEKVY